MRIFMGLMSGTSMDGVDAVLFDSENMRLLAQHKQPYSKALECDIKEVNRIENLSPDVLASLNLRIGEAFSEAALGLLASSALAEPILAIGSHGQTLLHKPNHNPSYTLQVGCPHLIALRTKLPVVADFRSRDMRLGGHGAPLAPLFHQVLFAKEQGEGMAVLNLGGIANISFLSNAHGVHGFDTGPANVLMDAYCREYLHCDFDEGGNIARTGRLLPQVLTYLKSHPFLALNPPKSADKHTFTGDWLKKLHSQNAKHEDLLHTLAQFTATTVIAAIHQNKTPLTRLICCGGGAKNRFVMELLADGLPEVSVESSADLGYPVDAIEAMMMAWLADMHCQKKALDYRLVTGAESAYVPGVFYPAG